MVSPWGQPSLGLGMQTNWRLQMISGLWGGEGRGPGLLEAIAALYLPPLFLLPPWRQSTAVLLLHVLLLSCLRVNPGES